MFLSPELLCDLTDRKGPRDQVEWLRARNYVFEVSAAGRPKVLIEYVRKRLGVADEAVKPPAASPNFDALRKRK